MSLRLLIEDTFKCNGDEMSKETKMIYKEMKMISNEKEFDRHHVTKTNETTTKETNINKKGKRDNYTVKQMKISRRLWTRGIIFL